MFVWMAYVIVVSALLGAAALAAEYRARLRRGSTRWMWMFAIIASLLVPTVIASVSIQVPDVFRPAATPRLVALRELTVAHLSPEAWIGRSAVRATDSRGIDVALKRAWSAVSILMLALLIAGGAHLIARKRRWTEGMVEGTFVLLSTNVGPAIVGLIRPQIVVPTWLLDAPLARQKTVVAHEQCHLDAGDPRLLTVALCLLVLMPWNLPLWWQLRRLRNAIEVDCDSRVLRAGHDVVGYGETLVAIGERQSGYIAAVAGMTESMTFLERRIEIMVRKPQRGWRLAAAGLGGLSLVLLAVAAEVSPPNAKGPSTAEHKEITLPGAMLDGYAGTYQLGANSIVTVKRIGDQLSAQLTGQPAVDIYPEAPAEFFYKIVNAQISFVPDRYGQATELVLHQNGRDIVAARVNPAVAEQISTNLKAKVRRQTPTPHSEAALRQLIAGVASGKPDFSTMSPELAKETRAQLTQLQAGVAALGAVQSIEFHGIGNAGWDVFEVRHEHGTSQWRIELSTTGIMTGALFTALP